MWVGEQGRACAEDNWLNGINNLLQSMFIGYLRYAIVSGGVKGQRFVLILSMVLAITAMIYRYWFFFTFERKSRSGSTIHSDGYYSWVVAVQAASREGEEHWLAVETCVDNYKKLSEKFGEKRRSWEQFRSKRKFFFVNLFPQTLNWRLHISNIINCLLF